MGGVREGAAAEGDVLGEGAGDVLEEYAELHRRILDPADRGVPKRFLVLRSGHGAGSLGCTAGGGAGAHALPASVPRAVIACECATGGDCLRVCHGRCFCLAEAVLLLLVGVLDAAVHPPVVTAHPPLATAHPPLATAHPPLATAHRGGASAGSGFWELSRELVLSLERERV